MGKYLSPDNPQSHEIKCAVIFYPNDDSGFFLGAIRGQLSALARPFIWEGDRAKTDEIAQIFTRTDLMTDDSFFGIDCELLPLLMGDETMEINVTCSCGGVCSGNPITLYCVNGDGTVQPTPQPPIDPTPIPPEGKTFPLDPAGDTPPDGYEDWTAYDVAFCYFSNALWITANILVKAIETLADVVAALAVLATLVTPLLPAAVIAAIGGVTFWQIVIQLAEILVSEQASDILNEIDQWMTEKKEDIVCEIYSHRYDWNGLPASLAKQAADYVEISVSMESSERNPVERLISTLFGYQLIGGYVANELIPYTGVEPVLIDCSGCSQTAGTVPFDILMTFDADGEQMEANQYANQWRADNGGERYTIGHVADGPFMGVSKRNVETMLSLTPGTIGEWFIEEIRFTIARNAAQAPESNPFITWKDVGGNEIDSSGITTTSNYVEHTFVNPNQPTAMWFGPAIEPGAKMNFPGVPGASSWFEYFVTSVRVVGSYNGV